MIEDAGYEIEGNALYDDRVEARSSSFRLSGSEGEILK
jgi:hypothetical protein